ncbi:MAG: hypothetical protein R3F61_31555 [Myxococcota bacterium]
MWFWLTLAYAQDDATPAEGEPEVPVEAEPEEPEPPSDPPEPVVFEIPPVEHALPSATRRLKDLEALSSDPAELDALLEAAGFEGDDFGFGSLVRGAWYVRPRFAVASLFRPDEGGSAVRLGFSAGRRFWTLEALPVQLAADIGLRGTAPIGAANGRRLEAQGAIGPWLGPARIQLSAGAKWERERWIQKAYELDDAWFLTLGGAVAFDFERVAVNVGVTPAFLLSGDRPRATAGDPALPVIGTETEWSAGIAIPLNPIGIALDASWRDTAIGGLLEVGVAFQFTPRRK